MTWNFDIYEDTNSKVRYFSDTMNELYVKNCPLKTKYLSEKRLCKPWLTGEILDKIKAKSNFFKLYKRGLISKAVIIYVRIDVRM